MKPLSIELEQQRTGWRPGETMQGLMRWSLEERAGKLELRLAWMTLGRGETDTDTVERVTIENPPPSGERPFSIRLPASPYSFSGVLVTLQWFLELRADTVKERARVDITISPSGKEILLPAEEDLHSIVQLPGDRHG